MLCDAISDVSLTVVTGPPIDDKLRLPVSSSPTTLKIVPAILIEYSNDRPTVEKKPKRTLSTPTDQ